MQKRRTKPKTANADDAGANRCRENYPDDVLCAALGPAYQFATPYEACRTACGKGYRAVNRVPSYNGPCIGKGSHYRCQSRGRFAGITVSCCPCCRSDGGSAEKIELCRYH